MGRRFWFALFVFVVFLGDAGVATAARTLRVPPFSPRGSFLDTAYPSTNIVLFVRVSLSNLSPQSQNVTVSMAKGSGLYGALNAPGSSPYANSVTLSGDLPISCPLSPSGTSGDSCIRNIRADCTTNGCQLFWDNGSTVTAPGLSLAQGLVELVALKLVIDVAEDRGAIAGFVEVLPYASNSSFFRGFHGVTALALNGGRPF